MNFRHEVIDDEPPSSELMLCLPADLTGNGRDDVIIGSNEGTIFWYENLDGGWERHDIAEVSALEAGGALADVSRNGRLDILAGEPLGHYNYYWFEQPENPRDEWKEHVVCSDYHKYHDQAMADVDDDGEPEIILFSQYSEIICYWDIPEDPQGSWPRSDRTVVAAGLGDVEGMQVLDIDRDGRTELVAGRHVFHRQDEEGDEWERERVAPDWEDERVRVQAVDIDENGETELLLTECELPALGERHGIYHDGRFAICSGPDWDPRVLRDDLHCPHSLQVADFDGDGRQDVYVAESDYGGYERPRHFVYENLGGGEFEEHLVHEGTATHEAKIADVTGNGRPDVVGKSDTEDAHVDALINEN